MPASSFSVVDTRALVALTARLRGGSSVVGRAPPDERAPRPERRAVSLRPLRAWRRRTDTRTDTCLATTETEQASSRLRNDDDLGVLLVHAELVEGCVEGFSD